MAAMGTAYRAYCEGYRIARRQAKQGGTPFLVAEKTLPDIAKLERAAAA
jgi:hypothetical protein